MKIEPYSIVYCDEDGISLFSIAPGFPAVPARGDLVIHPEHPGSFEVFRVMHHIGTMTVGGKRQSDFLNQVNVYLREL